jgi:hypothetical protein
MCELNIPFRILWLIKRLGHRRDQKTGLAEVLSRRTTADLDGATLIPEVDRGFGDFIVRNTLRFIAIVSCVLRANAVTAEPVQLNADAIKATLPGSVLKLDTPLGTVVPIKFDGNGLMSGDAGQLASYLGSQKDRGRYWLAEDRICYRWFRWFSGEQHCLAIQRDGQRIFWQRDDGETGTATLEEQHKAAPIPPAPATAAKPPVKYLAQHQRPASANDAASLAEPVLVKLPTLAVRPPKRAAVLAEEMFKAPLPNASQAPIRSPH